MITVVGLGPGDLNRVPRAIRDLLMDEDRSVVVRTLHHPASAELGNLREVVSCDDLYDGLETFDEVYQAIVERVEAIGADGPVVYAVPGSPFVGEFAARTLSGMPGVETFAAESFVDLLLNEIGYDPLDRGLQILNAHALPDPLVLDKPTVIAQIDRPEILADVAAWIGRLVVEDAQVLVARDLGTAQQHLTTVPIDAVEPQWAGLRTSLFIDAEPGGLVGAVHTMRRLREECPWDREQTHESLVTYLIEETYELVEAISSLEPGGTDWVGYANIEDELGDVLLQVLFHAGIAREVGAFDIDDVAEVMRQKLVRRHPHVFGDVEVGSADQVKRNWDEIKAGERGLETVSIVDGVPSGMPALQRATKMQTRAAEVGFDWPDAGSVMPKIAEELEELSQALGDKSREAAEFGDLMFSMVNLARHLGIQPEIALNRTVDRFTERLRRMESEGPLDGLDLAELDRRWESTKRDQ